MNNNNNIKINIGSICCATIFIVAGIVMILYAQDERASSWGYTWRPPYSDYEWKILIIKWFGIAFIISSAIGLVGNFVKNSMNQNAGAQVPMQNMNLESMNGGFVNCPKCGVRLLATTKNCPQCGSSVDTGNLNGISAKKNNKIFCAMCGNPADEDAVFCPKCGQKMMK